MGIYDREYYRESTQDRWSEWFAQRGTVALVAVTVGAFLLQMLLRAQPVGRGQDPLIAWGAFHVPSILAGEVWRFVTPIFLHADPVHLLFNMVVLYWFGTIIEGVYGTKEFVCFYLTAGVVVEVAEFFVRLSGALSPEVSSLGASGAVTAVMVLFACHFPYRRLRFWFLIPAPAWVVVCVLILADVLGVLGARRDNVNHIAHLFGATVGFAYFIFQLRVSNWLPSFGSWSAGRAAKPRLRVSTAPEGPTPEPVPAEPVAAAPRPPRPATASPVDEQLEAKLDHVLEKVARSGKESLTPEENEILLRASDIYKRRRGS
jgi:membrane associated rhomboid family serine protease